MGNISKLSLGYGHSILTLAEWRFPNVKNKSRFSLGLVGGFDFDICRVKVSQREEDFEASLRIGQDWIRFLNWEGEGFPARKQFEA